MSTRHGDDRLSRIGRPQRDLIEAAALNADVATQREVSVQVPARTMMRPPAGMVINACCSASGASHEISDSAEGCA
jgi:hypothetical protein